MLCDSVQVNFRIKPLPWKTWLTWLIMSRSPREEYLFSWKCTSRLTLLLDYVLWYFMSKSLYNKDIHAPTDISLEQNLSIFFYQPEKRRRCGRFQVKMKRHRCCCCCCWSLWLWLTSPFSNPRGTFRYFHFFLFLSLSLSPSHTHTLSTLSVAAVSKSVVLLPVCLSVCLSVCVFLDQIYFWMILASWCPSSRFRSRNLIWETQKKLLERKAKGSEQAKDILLLLLRHRLTCYCVLSAAASLL